MKRRAVHFAASALVAVVALTPSGVGALPRLAATSLRAAADSVSAVVPARCYKWELSGNGCQRICSEWLPKDLPGYSYIWDTTTNCNDNGFTLNQDTCKTNSRNMVMSKLTSCQASQGSSSDSCVVTVCGVMTTPFAPKPHHNAGGLLRVTQPTPKPKVGPPAPGLLAPGLLESDTGFVRQGPSATGTPAGTGGGARAPADGSRLR